MIDEVYTAKRIEYANGSFVGLTESGEPAKTVLAFKVQSSCSKFKDVVCLVPVSKLDSTKLKTWFNIIMDALKDIFCIVAISFHNHVCNRQAKAYTSLETIQDNHFYLKTSYFEYILKIQNHSIVYRC